MITMLPIATPAPRLTQINMVLPAGRNPSVPATQVAGGHAADVALARARSVEGVAREERDAGGSIAGREDGVADGARGLAEGDDVAVVQIWRKEEEDVPVEEPGEG